ncbi:MAG: hypothetical protein F4X75_01755, partial [Gemmatimonadetes bacterium]|nr:hypothetical protein [Gemmatimonadota bacterium]
DDTEAEADETFTVRLLDTPEPVEATGTITDNDHPPDEDSSPEEDRPSDEDSTPPEPFGFTKTVQDQAYTAQTAIPPLVLPAAAGGTPPLTYRLAGLPAGLTFDKATRTIAGTPAEATDGPRAVAYMATDHNGADDALIFTIMVNPELNFGEVFQSGTAVPTTAPR